MTLRKPVGAPVRRPGGALSLRPVLWVTIGALVAGHYAVLALGSGLDVDTKGSLTWLDLFQERSVGTWVNALILAAAGLAAAALAAASPWSPPRLRHGWAALAGLLVLASIDEVAGMHESAIHVIRSAVDLPGFLYYAAWTLPALALLAAFVVWQWRFFSLLPRWLAVRVAAAAGVYVAAAVGLEVVESQLFAETGGRDWTPVLQVLVGIEEGLEMGAAAVLLLAFVRHLTHAAPDWRLKFAVADAAPDGAGAELVAARRAEPRMPSRGTADDAPEPAFRRRPTAARF
jgi:hypothetical protein